MRDRWIASALATAVLLAAPSAFADRIALLPSHGGANPDARTALDGVLARGLTALGHTVIPANAAASGVADGVADTPEEYRQVGVAAHADWVLVGSIEPAVTTSRVELVASLMQLGRIESVAREVENPKADAQVQEMLRVLVRPEGVGVGELPWEKGLPIPPRQPQPQPQPVVTSPPAWTPPPLSPTPPAGPEPMVMERHYSGSNHGFFGATLGFSAPVARPSGASGSGASFTGALRGGYAIGTSGFEPFVEFGGNLVGPQALWISGGARYMRGATFYKGIGLWIGPELLVGAFVRLSGADVTGPSGVVYSDSSEAHPVFGAAFDLAVDLSSSFQLEAQLGNLRVIPASSGSIVLLGATLGGSLRF